MRGSRYVAGWVVVAALATSVAALTLELVRGAVGAGTALDVRSQADVASAYRAAQQAPASAPSATTGPSAWPSGTKVPSTGPSPTRTASSQPPSGNRTTPSSWPTSAPTHTGSPPPSTTPSSITKLLSSPGGSLVAQCTGSGDHGSVYLVSWSPAQGYSVHSVDRGPSDKAEIEFDSAAQSVSVEIRCTSSGPVQTVETKSGSAGGGRDH